MISLQELAFVVSNNRVDNIELVNNWEDSTSKLAEFYDGIVKGRFNSDEEAAEYFYQSDKQNSAYQKLKASLKNRLVNTLFFIDVKQPSYNDRQRAYYECYKDWASVKIMLGKNARHSAVSVAQKVLKYAKKYEFTELVVDLTKTLRLHFGSREGDYKKYRQFNEIYKQHKAICDREDLAEELYTELIVNYVNRKSDREVVHQKAVEYYDRIRDDLAQYDSYRLHLCGFMIELMIHSSLNQYEKVVKVCSRMLTFFDDKPYQADTPQQIAYYQMLVCHIQLRQYPEGKVIAEKCLALLEEGSFNWFKYQELYFILAMHTGYFQQAYEVLTQTLAHNRFNYLPANVREMWNIFRAYIHLMVELKKVTPAEDDDRFNKFKLGRFMNSHPIYSQDKRGMNIPILVVQILFTIIKRDYNKAIDKIEAIEKYCSRYLRQDSLFRSNCFIKMLLLIPEGNFHRVAIERKAEKFLERLREVPLEIANQPHEVEIIPYEDLWKLAVAALESKIYRQRQR